MISNESPPIFIWPLARTGGTLLACMLSVHPDLAISFEIYEENLLPSDIDSGSIDELISAVGQIQSLSGEIKLAGITRTKLRSFVVTALRGGLSLQNFERELRLFKASGGNLDNRRDRLTLIHRLQRALASQLDKPRFGGKMKTDLHDLVSLHPNAFYLAMARDPRDVFASRKNVGNFSPSLPDFTAAWRAHIETFLEFRASDPNRFMLVGYTNLVTATEDTLRQICAFIDAPYSPKMKNYADHNPALFDNPYGHLSAHQLKKGLSEESLNRWKSDLTPREADFISGACGDLFKELNLQ